MSAQPPAAARPLSAAAFRELYRRLRERAGEHRRGALDLITPGRVVAAATGVRSGRTVSLAAPVETRPGPDSPEPATHRMTAPTDREGHEHGLYFARDRFAMNVHGDVDSHLDALCHVMFDGELYGGVPAGTVTPDGAGTLTVDLVRDGIVGRGVLLDIPRLRGVPWLDPGDQVTAEDLAAAETAQGTRVGPGDVLLVRIGHRLRRRTLGAWDVTRARAGLHPTAMGFLAERQVSVLGSDGNSDAAPSAVAEVPFPVHVLAVNAMGVHLLDWLDFEELVPVCEEQGRWHFLCVVAPLRLPAATGSPVNPIAVL
ncbi:Kynurenine formamidase [Streptomyces sp. 1222.5]|uniref:cyclase family protein n=1 Tax=unclassified Streptomyces TaxID=2593676 RepID=UPI000898EFC0|nr:MULTISPECIES: cyclase family protein [unclassified Streptomyces]PKW12058.1 kynurenine formamidase [Streptomyces sp. 5112.2]SEB63604.1 Kynurenine formamidase [Streptomyces sp. 1222.5]